MLARRWGIEQKINICYNNSMAHASGTITLSKQAVRQKGGMVVLTIEEYRKLLRGVTPTYYLKGKAASNLDRLVNKALGEYKTGKTKLISSLADLE